MNPLLEAALERAHQGAYVLPLWWTDEASLCQCPKDDGCTSSGKHPLVEHGLDDASNDPDTIERWWARWPQANVGVRTDKVVRIDIDLLEVAATLAEDVAIPSETEVVRTPHGGMHIALRVSGQVGGGPLYLQDGKRLGDLKASRGYVLVPPSRIGDGYYVSLSSGFERVIAVDDPRSWLADILSAFGFTLAENLSGWRHDYSSLGGTIHEGEGRHNALVSYAGRVWVERMGAETLAALLDVVNEQQCLPPLPELEVRTIADHFIVRRERRRSSGGGTGRHYSGSVSQGDHPSIVITNRHLHEIVKDAWEALFLCNVPPRYFQYGGIIAEIGRYDAGRARIIHLGLAGLKGRLDRSATWLRITDHGPRPARPPRDVVEDMEALPKPLPVLRGVIGTPTFTSDSTLVMEPGYQTRTGLYYEPKGEAVPNVPDRPDATDIKRAKQIIGQEWLADFPFIDDASRTHAIAVPLTAIARELIDGPTPLFAIDAPAAGTGKGLLAAGVGIIVSGAAPAVMSESRSEEEVRKRVTALLLSGVSVILFDNLKYRVESGTLSALLTAPTWSDRLLGKSQTLELPNRALWLATGNNIELNNELARRTIWVRLDAKVNRPWERSNFHHPDLTRWLSRHRHEVVWAFLVLVQNWIAQGSPEWEGRPLGSFEAWCSVLGGILAAAGIQGFLENREDLYRRADTETEEWRAFTGHWWDRYGAKPVKAADLVEDALELLPSVFEKAKDGASERAIRTRLGKAIAERQDRRFADLFIRRAGEDGHAKGTLWCLEAAPAGEEVADVVPKIGRTSAQHPHANRSDSDSNAEDAELADVVLKSGANSASEEENAREVRKPHPHHPQVPQTDTNSADSNAEDMRKTGPIPADVPRCVKCGREMGVARVGNLCGRCRSGPRQGRRGAHDD